MEGGKRKMQANRQGGRAGNKVRKRRLENVKAATLEFPPLQDALSLRVMLQAQGHVTMRIAFWSFGHFSPSRSAALVRSLSFTIYGCCVVAFALPLGTMEKRHGLAQPMIEKKLFIKHPTLKHPLLLVVLCQSTIDFRACTGAYEAVLHELEENSLCKRAAVTLCKASRSSLSEATKAAVHTLHSWSQAEHRAFAMLVVLYRRMKVLSGADEAEVAQGPGRNLQIAF